MAQHNLSKIVDEGGDEYLIKAKGLENQIQISLTGDVSGTVTTDLSGNASISTTIGNGAVTTSKIDDSAVTTAKINDKAVTLDKIADAARGGAVSDNDGVLATHSQVKSYVDSVVSGEGKYRGTQTVATINGWTVSNLNNGDRVITSDSGTITFNGQSLPVAAAQELVLWKDTSTNPVTAVWQTSEGNYKLTQTAVTASGSALKTPTTISQNTNGDISVTFSDIQNASTSQKGVVQLSDSTSSTSTTLAATANAVKTAYDLASGAKPKQTAKTSPTASGTDIAFIDTITQDANGVITATKKTVRSASTSQSGVMSATDKAKLDKVSAIGSTDIGTPLMFVNQEDLGYGRKDGYIGLGGYTNDGRYFVGTNTSGELVLAKSQDAETFTEVGKIALDGDLPDISGKADKVSEATSGNFAGLDNNGNLTDSGSKASDFATSSHSHGNITNGGAITATGVTPASGDALVIADASDSSKLAKTSITFDGSTATKALTQKGTWESFNNYTHPAYTAASAAAVKVGRDSTGHVVIGNALAKGDVGLGNVDNTADSSKNVLSATKLYTARDIDGVSFDGTASIHRFGSCSTAAATAAKTVTLDDSMSFTLAKGASVFVKFTNANTATNPTLNVNGTGDKTIYRYGSTAPGTTAATSWQANSVVHLVYDGEYWRMVGWLNDNTTYVFDETYNASTNKAATVRSITDRINALDAEETSSDGTNVQVKVTETDGKVTAVSVTTDNTEAAFSIAYRASDNALVFGKAFGTTSS